MAATVPWVVDETNGRYTTLEIDHLLYPRVPCVHDRRAIENKQNHATSAPSLRTHNTHFPRAMRDIRSDTVYHACKKDDTTSGNIA